MLRRLPCEELPGDSGIHNRNAPEVSPAEHCLLEEVSYMLYLALRVEAGWLLRESSPSSGSFHPH